MYGSEKVKVRLHIICVEDKTTIIYELNATRSTGVDVMLGRRRRRCPNITPTVVQRVASFEI